MAKKRCTHLNVHPVKVLNMKRMGDRLLGSEEHFPLCDTPCVVSYPIVKETAYLIQR